MRRVVTGEELAQLYNPDPFAMPRWRAPVYRTPFGIILVAKFARLLVWLIRMIVRHPLAASVLALAAATWVKLGWVTLVALVLAAVVILTAWRWFWPVSFSRWVGRPARSKWRAWCYRRRWAAVMTIAGVAPWYQGRTLLPVLGKVTATRYVDRVYVRLVSGQGAADFTDHADNLAHGFRALLCRVRTARSGAVVLEFIRRDALAALVPALPIPANPDLKALPVGRREDGLPWLVKLHGTHVLIAGATGAGKASLLWGLVRAMFPLMQTGMVRVLAADPKLMELAYGRVIFDTYGHYAADPAAIAAMLDQAVADMQDRASRFAGRQRDHTPTIADPFTVVLVDEVAFLTAYQPDRNLKTRIMSALATLTTQGRAVGYSVVAALQDPRKDVLTIRNLFPDRIAMRLDEPEQVDMVLGDGARDRGAACELIPADPATGAGVAFVRLEADPDPVRVRAGWVTVTLTCPSYGRVDHTGAPVDPNAYDYQQAARDALTFAALFDRFIQNLRRYLGYDVQYFAAVEPQRRLAPHIHIAIRGTVARSELRRVLAATYHQVWWPDPGVKYGDGDQLPVWHEQTGQYVDPATGEVLPTWDEALDGIGPYDLPWHVARFGDRFDAQGVIAGSPGAARCIGYLTKYLTKHVGGCHPADTDAQRAHAARLAEALRFQPCSPRCANWLRYGIQPKGARPSLAPGRCKGKAHDADHLGYAGRRVLVSRKWSGKTLADHRADRKDWLLRTLGVSATDPARYAWEPVAPCDPDHMEHARRLLHVVADRLRWQIALSEARLRARLQSADPPAEGRAA